MLANNINPTCTAPDKTPVNVAIHPLDAPLPAEKSASAFIDDSICLVVSATAVAKASILSVAIFSASTISFCAAICASIIFLLPVPFFCSARFFLVSAIFSALYCRLCLSESAWFLAMSAYSPPSAAPAWPIVPAFSIVACPILSAYFAFSLITVSVVKLFCFSNWANRSPFSRWPSTVASCIAPALLITVPKIIRSRRFLRSISVIPAIAVSSSSRCVLLILDFSASNASSVFSSRIFSALAFASSPVKSDSKRKFSAYFCVSAATWAVLARCAGGTPRFISLATFALISACSSKL